MSAASTQFEQLGGPVLRAVSRSFYLTIRLLPTEVRGAIGLAYLLARASDTIADSALASAAVRLAHLTEWDRMIAGGGRVRLALLQAEIVSESVGEQALVAALPGCLDWLEALDEVSRDEIRRVLPLIIRGQRLDLERFPAAGGQGTVIALPDAAALEEYTFLVAGCVGEFWTRLCLRRLSRYSDVGAEELTRLGVNFGKALQLINILRDMPNDLRTGRCYLPEAELRALEVDPAELSSELARAQPVWDRWRERAGALLEDGRLYLRAIRPARLRLGCYLPWELGGATLREMDRRPPLRTPERVKVPRSTVRRALARGMWVAVSNRPLATS